MKKINVALIGLGFGGCFADIYKAHPSVERLVLFDIDKNREKMFRDRLGITEEYETLDAILADKTIDAVHLVTPIPLHAEQSVAVLNAGKHCACTVPMAISVDGIRKIIAAKKASGKHYMMMETTLYTYQYFYVKKLLEEGKLGKLQFMRGCHYQDMSHWPKYWMGLPPMYYGTHAIAPMVGLSGSRIKRVVCFGSGSMDESLHEQYGNPYPVESALFEFDNGQKAEATRSLFETARSYCEGFCIYGSNTTFEWGHSDGSNPIITTMKPRESGRGNLTEQNEIEVPNFYLDLPEELRRFTVGEGFDPLNPQESLKKGAGGGHHGSHPHLVHEFVSSIIENRKPWIDEYLAANITAAGVLAHESAMKNGASIEIPDFSKE